MPINKYGTRSEVMRGIALMTAGGLKKKDLKYNKDGKIVSKKLSNIVKTRNKNYIGGASNVQHKKKERTAAKNISNIYRKIRTKGDYKINWKTHRLPTLTNLVYRFDQKKLYLTDNNDPKIDKGSTVNKFNLKLQDEKIVVNENNLCLEKNNVSLPLKNLASRIKAYNYEIKGTKVINEKGINLFTKSSELKQIYKNYSNKQTKQKDEKNYPSRCNVNKYYNIEYDFNGGMKGHNLKIYEIENGISKNELNVNLGEQYILDLKIDKKIGCAYDYNNMYLKNKYNADKIYLYEFDKIRKIGLLVVKSAGKAAAKAAAAKAAAAKAAAKAH